MTSAASGPRLDAAQVRAIRRAGQLQLKRWNKTQLDADQQQRAAELRRALQTLRTFRDGCELHPIDDGRGQR